jgi:hypothetical protein
MPLHKNAARPLVDNFVKSTRRNVIKITGKMSRLYTSNYLDLHLSVYPDTLKSQQQKGENSWHMKSKLKMV